MNWISVKDKLPNSEEFEGRNCCQHDAVYIYAAKPIHAPHSLFGIASWHEDSWDIVGDEGANSCTGSWKLTSEDITHWAFLSKEPDDL